MLANLVGTLAGAAMSLISLIMSLLPAVSLDSLPIAVPESVQGVLSAVNWFVSIGSMIDIVGWWILLLTAVNVFLLAKALISSVKS